jgi:hypothetical protein
MTGETPNAKPDPPTEREIADAGRTSQDPPHPYFEVAAANVQDAVVAHRKARLLRHLREGARAARREA